MGLDAAQAVPVRYTEPGNQGERAARAVPGAAYGLNSSTMPP